MIHHYDTRWATYEPDGSTRLMTADEKAAHVPPMPRYWVHECEIDKKLDGLWGKTWFLGWRDITNATNERTVIASLIPRTAVGNQMPLVFPATTLSDVALLQASLSSFALDFVARQKTGGTHMNFFIFEQLPLPRPGTLTGNVGSQSWVASRVELLNSWVADEQRRSQLRAELDAYCLHVYGLKREDAAYLLDTFPIVKAKDIKEFGEYRTKRLILEAYDAMGAAIEAGEPLRPVLEGEVSA